MINLSKWGRLWAALFLVAGTAQAHGVRTDVRISLDTPKIAGLVIELHQGDIAPQLVLENRSGKMLEILDAQARPFLRIGNGQVEANVHSAEWQASLNPVAVAQRKSASNAPKWLRIRGEPSYGWFDTRLNTETIQIPQAIVAVGEPVPLARWQIAAVFDGKPLDIQGQFIYQPPLRGIVQAVMRSARELAPGITVALAPGNPPALFLQNHGKQTVHVLDTQGQAFLSIGPDGVRADTSSAAWRAASGIPPDRMSKCGEAARTPQCEPPPQKKSGWQKISAARSTTWLEPRLQYHGAPPADPAQRQTLDAWHLPLQAGQQKIEIYGEYQWIPAPRPR